MSYLKPNPLKENLINKYGQTFGLPLFEDKAQYKASPTQRNLPNWIWDASGVKAEVYNKLKGHLAESRLKVIMAMLKLGGAATDEEIHEQSGLRLSSVNARRNELITLGVIYSFNYVKKLGSSGVPNTVWHLNLNKLHEFYSSIN